MFQYTKENILNDVPVIKKSGEKVIIEGLGEYTLSGIVDKTIYETEGYEGKPATRKYETRGLGNGGDSTLSFRVTTSKPLAEFASPNWNEFGKPIIVNVGAITETDKIEKMINFANPEGNKLFDATFSEGILTLKGLDSYTDFDKVVVEAFTPEWVVNPCVEAEGSVAHKEPFATKEWIIENLRFPTYPNIRYGSANTMPTADVYTEFAFTYEVPRVGLGGLSGVGQGMTAVTRHIFYLPKGEKANAFKAELTEALGATLKFDTNAPGDTNKNYENNLIPDEIPVETEE